MGEWQPIETASRDERVLALCDDGCAAVCVWIDGLWVLSFNHEPFEYEGATVLYWMPIPESPK